MKRSAAKQISARPQAFVADQRKSHIHQLCQCLAQEFQPEKIIIFGSYADGHPSYDATVFHAQQCIEKYLKARLEEASLPFQRIHDLLLLPSGSIDGKPSWQAL